MRLSVFSWGVFSCVALCLAAVFLAAFLLLPVEKPVPTVSAAATVERQVNVAAAADIRPRADRIEGPLSAHILRVMDGDTLSVRVQVWIGQSIVTDVRLAGLDAPELAGRCDEERLLAAAARARLEELLADGRVLLSNIRLEKYAGRVLAEAFAADGTPVAATLIAEGLARPYQGGRRDEWCDSAARHALPAQRMTALSGKVE